MTCVPYTLNDLSVVALVLVRSFWDMKKLRAKKESVLVAAVRSPASFKSPRDYGITHT